MNGSINSYNKKIRLAFANIIEPSQTCWLANLNSLLDIPNTDNECIIEEIDECKD